MAGWEKQRLACRCAGATNLFAPQAPGVAILSSGLTPSNPTIRAAVRSSSYSTLGMCTTASGR
jgi:hypothetical protein